MPMKWLYGGLPPAAQCRFFVCVFDVQHPSPRLNERADNGKWRSVTPLPRDLGADRQRSGVVSTLLVIFKPLNSG